MVKSKYISLFIVGLLLVACAAPPTPPDGPDTEVNIKIVNLAQGWNEQTQLDFWFTSQGSQIMPYRWFLALEQSGNQELLRSDKNMRRLGYLPSKNTSGGRM